MRNVWRWRESIQFTIPRERKNSGFGKAVTVRNEWNPQQTHPLQSLIRRGFCTHRLVVLVKDTFYMNSHSYPELGRCSICNCCKVSLKADKPKSCHLAIGWNRPTCIDFIMCKYTGASTSFMLRVNLFSFSFSGSCLIFLKGWVLPWTSDLEVHQRRGPAGGRL